MGYTPHAGVAARWGGEELLTGFAEALAARSTIRPALGIITGHTGTPAKDAYIDLRLRLRLRRSLPRGDGRPADGSGDAGGLELGVDARDHGGASSVVRRFSSRPNSSPPIRATMPVSRRPR
ncbi:hypothetical protein AB0M54_18135 [Actinoplanes sp. NPDC051470]|uniref:hypothetical protein n=1 Tax=Actinoplanes sp. NPDC051470 TaxID=3157224 RepID=UPI00342CEAF8